MNSSVQSMALVGSDVDLTVVVLQPKKALNGKGISRNYGREYMLGSIGYKCLSSIIPASTF